MLTLTPPLVRPFRVADATGILNRDGSQGTPAQLIRQAQAGPAFTAEVDGQILCCAGLLMPWAGFGQVWMVIGDDLGAHGFWVSKTVRRLLDDLSKRNQLHRLEAVALEESPRNQQWLEWLGFTSEKNGRAQSYLADCRSVIRYERIEA